MEYGKMWHSTRATDDVIISKYEEGPMLINDKLMMHVIDAYALPQPVIVMMAYWRNSFGWRNDHNQTLGHCQSARETLKLFPSIRMEEQETMENFCQTYINVIECNHMNSNE